MKILAIDPGNVESAYVIWHNGAILDKGKIGNDQMLEVIEFKLCDEMAIEMIASYGMAVGATVFETCVWVGRFVQKWVDGQGGPWGKVYRKDVKMHLCQSMRAKDANIRQALIDLFPETGGGATPQIGTKAKPGPLYGCSKDIWAALGVALTYEEMSK